MDEKTETVILVVESENIPYDDVSDAITSMGGSIHSIDEVEVISMGDSADSSTQTDV